MNIPLTIPSTPTVNVVYKRAGVNYGTIIPNPRSSSEVYRVMLFKHHIPAKDVVRVEPVQPLKRSFCYASF